MIVLTPPGWPCKASRQCQSSGQTQILLTRPGDQVAEGRQVVEQLERLKVPDESKMGASELSCWRENKKTITNSLKTLSRWQIVSDLPQSALLKSVVIVL